MTQQQVDAKGLPWKGCPCNLRYCWHVGCIAAWHKCAGLIVALIMHLPSYHVSFVPCICSLIAVCKANLMPNLQIEAQGATSGT